MADDKKSAKAPAVPKVEILAFFTTGDTRPTRGIPSKAPSAAKLTSTQRYKKRAESLATAGRVHGVNSIQEALNILKALPPNVKLSQIYFVGHGFDDGFFFHGRPDPKDRDNFISDDGANETLQNQNTLGSTSAKKLHQEFVDEIPRHLHKGGHIEIGFLSCFTGTGKTIQAVGKAIAKKGFQEFKVGSYINDYQTRYVFDSKSGAILKWTDEILDRKTLKPILKEDNNRIPEYEEKCGKSSDPLSFLLPC